MAVAMLVLRTTGGMSVHQVTAGAEAS